MIKSFYQSLENLKLGDEISQMLMNTKWQHNRNDPRHTKTGLRLFVDAWYKEMQLDVVTEPNLRFAHATANCMLI